MHNFNFYTPTKVIFGKETENKVGEEIKEYNGSKVVIVYGGGSVVRSGLLDSVTKNLDENNIEYIEIGGVHPNPRLSFAREATEKSKKFGADFILAVGGGSVIDTAKGIAHGVANPDIDIWDFWEGKEKVTKSLPIGVILTISAAGSEMSDSAVLTNKDTGVKRGLSTDYNRPKFAIMNPVLTFTLPTYQVQCGVVDILMHTLDRYFTKTENNEMTDAIAEALLRVVFKNGKVAVENKEDYDAMSELMWAGSLSHNSITGLGAEIDFAPHRLGHSLSAKYDVAHGASLSTVWGHWANYVKNVKIERFARYASEVFGINEGTDEEKADEGIKRTVEYFKSINMPTNFKELGIPVQDEKGLEELTNRCFYVKGSKVGKFLPLEYDDIYKIYTSANK